MARKTTRGGKYRPPVAAPQDRIAERIPLKDLHFDVHNPRFGPGGTTIKDEAKILDRIVNIHGVGDLLSSLSVNGYSDAEPLIGMREKDGRITIKEGNRRLAACLIIAEDPRAQGQSRRKETYSELRKKFGERPVDPVPVIIFQSDEYNLILPYLGVKHIVGAEEWSAWAKAAWADELINVHKVPLDEAMAMIGDEQRQLPRWLSSYYFVQQLIEEKRFKPVDSAKKGGGGSEFPFSLIYNVLGYSNVKEWVGFAGDSEPKHNPIPKNKLDAATDLIDFICGNKSKGIAPIATDNRQFKYLNKVAGDKESIVLLKNGEPLEKVARRLEPAADQLLEGLVSIQQELEEILGIAGGSNLSDEDRRTVLPTARTVAMLAHQIFQLCQAPVDLFGTLDIDLISSSKRKAQKKGKF